MGNGAVPNGLSYRAHPRLYRSSPGYLGKSTIAPVAHIICPGANFTAGLVTAEILVAAELPSNLEPVQYRDAGHSHHRTCSDRSLFPQESARRQ
jgi:hypothetical protein